MIKGILKEIIIILLLTLGVILLLGVLLYEYVPMNKAIPEQVSYTANEEVRTALEEKQANDTEEVILSYEVTSTDLKNYQRVNEYQAGRKNPFASINAGNTTTTTNSANNTSEVASPGTTTTNTSSNTTSSANTNTSGTTTSNTNSNSTNYYPDKGTK